MSAKIISKTATNRITAKQSELGLSPEWTRNFFRQSKCVHKVNVKNVLSKQTAIVPTFLRMHAHVQPTARLASYPKIWIIPKGRRVHSMWIIWNRSLCFALAFSVYVGLRERRRMALAVFTAIVSLSLSIQISEDQNEVQCYFWWGQSATVDNFNISVGVICIRRMATNETKRDPFDSHFIS